jgi:hypothetical protein
MIGLAYVALFGIPLLAAALIWVHRGSPAVVAGTLVGGWLAMPILALEVGGAPRLDKASLLGVSVALATWLARPRGAGRLGVRWFDLPVIAFCLAPLAASLSNGLGPYDGVSAALRQTLVWGVPYLVGRMIGADRGVLLAVGRVLLVGVAVYAPLCLIESRIAPQLHEMVYGIPGRANWEQVPLFGPLRWKPAVFLQSALELTPLMGIGFLFGWWMRHRGVATTARGRPRRLLVGTALVATVLGKALGALGLTIGSVLVLWLGQRLRTRVFLLAMLAVAPLYAVTRTLDLWDGRSVAEFVRENISERRAESFETRLIHEDVLVDHALRRPVFGWGGWGSNRSRSQFVEGQDRSLTDGLWVITLGMTGAVGLAAWLASLLLPACLLLSHLSGSSWHDPRGAVLQYAAVVLGLHAIDCLMNAMPNPVYYLIAGAACSVVYRERSLRTAPSPAPSPRVAPAALAPRHR